MAQTSNLRGIICMLASGFTFVLNDSLLKLAMAGLPPYEVLVMRGLSGAFFALVLLGLNGELKFQSGFISRPVVLRAVLECGAILTYIIALAHAPIGDVTAIFQTTPLLVIMGMIFIHGEQAALWRLGLIVLGFIGALLVAQPGQGTISPFVMLAFLTAVFAALRDLAARKIDPSIPAMFSTLVLIVTVLSVASLVSGISMWAASHLGIALLGMADAWLRPDVAQIGMTFGAGLLMMLGHHFTLLAYRSASAQAVAPFYYSFMIFAVVVGFLLFGDKPNLLGVVGMLTIMVSGLVLLAFERRPLPTAELP